MNPSSQPKPKSELTNPEITRLPDLTIWRRAFRFFMIRVINLFVRLCSRCSVTGLENMPRTGAALLVSNHLGDADTIVGLAFTPKPFEVISKAEMHEFPLLGQLMDAYGVIWVHRGQPDRRALRAALDGLSQGRMVALAPEGRESLTGALEEGTRGAAYLALKADVPILPVTFTGTENQRVYGNLRRFRRPKITITVGKLIRLEPAADQREAIRRGTQKIMQTLAAQLPEEYRGVYKERESLENEDELVEAKG